MTILNQDCLCAQPLHHGPRASRRAFLSGSIACAGLGALPKGALAQEKAPGASPGASTYTITSCRRPISRKSTSG